MVDLAILAEGARRLHPEDRTERINGDRGRRAACYRRQYEAHLAAGNPPESFRLNYRLTQADLCGITDDEAREMSGDDPAPLSGIVIEREVRATDLRHRVKCEGCDRRQDSHHTGGWTWHGGKGYCPRCESGGPGGPVRLVCCSCGSSPRRGFRKPWMVRGGVALCPACLKAGGIGKLLAC